jgi:hypothetical protein
MYYLYSKILHSLIFSVKILWERMKRDTMVCDNNKIDLKNKLNIDKYRELKSTIRCVFSFSY